MADTLPEFKEGDEIPGASYFNDLRRLIYRALRIQVGDGLIVSQGSDGTVIDAVGAPSGTEIIPMLADVGIPGRTGTDPWTPGQAACYFLDYSPAADTFTTSTRSAMVRNDYPSPVTAGKLIKCYRRWGVLWVLTEAC